MQNKQFKEALKALSGDLNKLSTKELTADQLLLFRARAYDYSKQPQKVIQTVDQFITKYSDSKWIVKAKFLKAKALVDLKKTSVCRCASMADNTKLDIIQLLLERNIDHAVLTVFEHIPYETVIHCRLVSKTWRHFVDSEVLRSEEFQKKERAANLLRGTPPVYNCLARLLNAKNKHVDGPFKTLDVLQDKSELFYITE